MAETVMARIRIKGDVRRPCILLCGFVVFIIIWYSYARQSHSATGAEKQTWATKSELKTKAELNLDRNDLLNHTLIGTMDGNPDIRDTLTGGDISLSNKQIALPIKPSATDKDLHIMDNVNHADRDERLEFSIGRKLGDEFRRIITTRPSLTNQNAKIARKKKITEAELRILLKTEIDAAESTSVFERDMTSRFRSVGKTILIIGYHRTGSSLLGKTFQIYPGTFYLFEPLHILSFAENLTFINGTRIPNLPVHYPMTNTLIVRCLLTCNLHQLPLEVLMDNHHVGHTDSLEHTVYCLQRYMSNFVKGTDTRVEEYNINNKTSVINAFWTTLSSMRKAEAVVNGMTSRCLQPAVHLCLGAHVRVYKFIKLRMPEIMNVLRDTSDVSFIHLLRDPRGNIHSQSRLIIQKTLKKEQPDFFEKTFSTRRTMYFKEFISIANKYCSEVRRDIAVLGSFIRQYSNRILTVLYERFATAPLTTAKWLYTFAGLPFQDKTEDFIWHLTLSGHRTNCSYCVERGNATNSAFKWREKIHSTQLRIINELCRDIYPVMGLKQLQHISDVRNMGVSIIL